MRHTTKLYLIIAGLIAVIFVRECKHAQRTHYFITQQQQLEHNIKNAYNNGFNACLEQF